MNVGTFLKNNLLDAKLGETYAYGILMFVLYCMDLPMPVSGISGKITVEGFSNTASGSPIETRTSAHNKMAMKLDISGYLNDHL